MSLGTRWANFKANVPSHPTWRMVIVILFLMFLGAALGASVLKGMSNSITALEANNATLTTEVEALQAGIDEVASQQAAGRERGYINRSVGCMSLIVDDDRTFPLTDECTDPNIAKYYPQQVCEMLPVVVPGCGSQSARPEG